MLEYFAYKKYKKHKTKKEAEDAADKTTSSSPSSDAAPAPVLTEDDERFLEQLTSLSAGADDEGARPPLPPRVKTPELTWDSDSESFRKLDAADAAGAAGTPSDKPSDRKANRLSLFLRRDKKPSSSSSSRAGAHLDPTRPVVTEPEAARERDDLVRVLDDLNLSARNNRAFSLSAESAELVRRFTLVLKDLVHGVPTAVHDLTALLEDRDGTLSRSYEKLPRSLQKLVTQLPDKLTSSLAPELLATASAAAAASGEAEGGGGGGLKGAAKRLFVPKNLGELVTKPGAIVSMLKGIMNALKLRWPAFVGTNVVWSVALFLLLFVLWYCHKRGREVRLEGENAAKAEERAGDDGGAASPAAGIPTIVEPSASSSGPRLPPPPVGAHRRGS